MPISAGGGKPKAEGGWRGAWRRRATSSNWLVVRGRSMARSMAQKATSSAQSGSSRCLGSWSFQLGRSRSDRRRCLLLESSHQAALSPSLWKEQRRAATYLPNGSCRSRKFDQTHTKAPSGVEIIQTRNSNRGSKNRAYIIILAPDFILAPPSS